jgi:hypothetical protein
LINKTFNPSKTAQNGLNFVTKDEENNLSTKEQPQEIINIFKLIYIILGIDYTSIPDNLIIQHLTKDIYTQLGVENLSKQ